MDDPARMTAGSELEADTLRYDLREVIELDPDDLAEAMKSGRLEVAVDGALSEWGSRLESLINKLERAVMHWHEPGRSKTVVITFVEVLEDASDTNPARS